MDSASIQKTADGSHTLYSSFFEASYHSIHGALEESIHVFISAGIDYFPNTQPLTILEMGFGTGLNAWLSYLHSTRFGRKIHYETIELHPVSEEVVSQLNYTSALPCTAKEAENFIALHSSAWNRSISFDNHFTLHKHQTDILSMDIPESIDLIFFDAFAPNCQSELWESELHKKLFDSLSPNGILVTYCAKGTFKRMLRSIGYTLDPLAGPGRKHEMTRAIKMV